MIIAVGPMVSARMRHARAGASILVMALSLLAAAARADTTVEPVREPKELKRLSLDELFNLEVTSASKSPEPISRTAAAIQVITNEEVHRSGATSIPEALRLAPNLDVAQVNAHDWAISPRGFNGGGLNGGVADKLLVMIDGRSVYTPLFAGVFWDVQNVLLEDLDRIEVGSGPGGTLWGANAVNGVINVVTRDARETQGFYVAGGAGTALRHFVAARYGGAIGSDLHYRVYAQGHDREDTERPAGVNAGDATRLGQGGFRMDFERHEADHLSVQGDAYGGHEGWPTTANVEGENLVGRWRREFSNTSSMTLQAYFDRTWREFQPPTPFADGMTTWDVDGQHGFTIGPRQAFLYGAGYRINQDDTRNGPTTAFLPPRRRMELFSAFLRDVVALSPDRLSLTIGAKVERNSFTGWEFQPGVRLAWTPAPSHMMWVRVARAVRQPSRFDTDVLFTSPVVGPFLGGNKDFVSEKLLAWELGARARPNQDLTFTLAAYYNEYDDLRSIDLAPTPPPLWMFANGQSAHTSGGELTAAWQARPNWRLTAGYGYLAEDFHANDPNIVAGSKTLEASDPAHRVRLQSLWNLGRRATFDVTGRYVDVIHGTVTVPPYGTMDARLAGTIGSFELAVTGQSLLQERHAEYGLNQIPRSVYGSVECRF